MNFNDSQLSHDLLNSAQDISITDDDLGRPLGQPQYFDQRSNSEMPQFSSQARPRGLEHLRNESYTTVGLHEIRSVSSTSQHVDSASFAQYDLTGLGS